MDLFLFRTEAIPPAEIMLQILGEIAADQQRLLQSDLNDGRIQLTETQRRLVATGLIALGLALLRLISSEGNISFEGEPIDGLGSGELRPLRREMQIVFQDPFSSLSPRLSIFQIVEEGLLVHGLGATYGERRAMIAEALGEVGLDPSAMDRYPHEFSGGQRQRVAIARAMVLKPKFVVLDEPMVGLDPQHARVLKDILRERADAGVTVFVSTHQLSVAEEMADRIGIMHQGRLVAVGSHKELQAANRDNRLESIFLSLTNDGA